MENNGDTGCSTDFARLARGDHRLPPPGTDGHAALGQAEPPPRRRRARRHRRRHRLPPRGDRDLRAGLLPAALVRRDGGLGRPFHRRRARLCLFLDDRVHDARRRRHLSARGTAAGRGHRGAERFRAAGWSASFVHLAMRSPGASSRIDDVSGRRGLRSPEQHGTTRGPVFRRDTHGSDHHRFRADQALCQRLRSAEERRPRDREGRDLRAPPPRAPARRR